MNAKLCPQQRECIKTIPAAINVWRLLQQQHQLSSIYQSAFFHRANIHRDDLMNSIHIHLSTSVTGKFPRFFL